ncbi:MAG TPA: hypothetical protein VG844_06135, partial [Terracidiphilus sp.]|nr:hypothetical protein [Terracidiphilus sp.]
VHGRSTVPKDLPGPVPLPNASADTSAAPKDWLQVDSPSELLFTASGADKKYKLIPMYRIASQRYAAYWQLHDKEKQS